VSDHLYLSVIVPAYNEAQRLPKTLRRLQEYREPFFRYEILVVIDGSLRCSPLQL
jgi:glycosyltransferase involved in cell wall biosynthesis